MHSQFRSQLSLLFGFFLILLAGCQSIPKEPYSPIRVVCDDQLREVAQEFFPEIARNSGRTIETRFVPRTALTDYALSHPDIHLLIATQERDVSSIQYLFEFRDPKRAPVLVSEHHAVILVPRDQRDNPEGSWLKKQLTERGWYERLEELGQPMNRYTLLKEERDLWNMIEGTQLDSIQFQKSSVPEALQHLEHELRKQKPAIPTPFFTNRIHTQPAPSLTLEIRNLSILECLHILTDITGTHFRVHSRGVELYSKGNTGKHQLMYRVHPDLEPIFTELTRPEGPRKDVLLEWKSPTLQHAIRKLQHLDSQLWRYEEMIKSLIITNPDHLDLHKLEDQLWRIHQAARSEPNS